MKEARDFGRRRLRTTPFIVLACIFVLLLVMNLRTPLYSDDYAYVMDFVTKQPVRSLGQLWESQKLHYLQLNGRAVVHCIGQLQLWLGEPGNDVVNALGFSLLCLVIVYHGAGSLGRISAGGIALVFAGLWFLTPEFGSSFLWTIGAANYLFGILIVLLFYIPYRRVLRWEDRRPHSAGREALCAILMLLGGGIAGWTNENTGAALALLVLCTLVVFRGQKKRIRPWMITGFLGVCAGVLLMLRSPAQQNRLAGAGGMGSLQDCLTRAERILQEGYSLFRPLVWITVLCALVLVLAVLFRRCPARALAPPILFAIAAAGATLAMALSPQFPLRVWSGILALDLIVPVACVVPVLYGRQAGDKAHKRRRRGTLARRLIGVVAVALLAGVAVSANTALQDLARTRKEFDQRAATISAAVAAGQHEMHLHRITSQNRYNCFSMAPELEPDPDDWKNVAMARYWGLDFIYGEDS